MKSFVRAQSRINRTGFCPREIAQSVNVLIMNQIASPEPNTALHESAQ